MARMVDADDLGGAQEIANLAGVSLPTAYEWGARPDFPRPVVRIGKKTGVWLLSEVAVWFASRPPPELAGHGTNACYLRGCRQAECREAHNAYGRAYKRGRREAARA